MTAYQVVAGGKRFGVTDPTVGLRFARALQAATHRPAYVRRTRPICDQCGVIAKQDHQHEGTDR